MKLHNVVPTTGSKDHYDLSVSLDNDLAYTSLTVMVGYAPPPPPPPPITHTHTHACTQVPDIYFLQQNSRCSNPANTTYYVHIESSAHFNGSTCQRADDTVDILEQKLEFKCGGLELNRAFNVTIIKVVGGKPIDSQKHKLCELIKTRILSK